MSANGDDKNLEIGSVISGGILQCRRFEYINSNVINL